MKVKQKKNSVLISINGKGKFNPFTKPCESHDWEGIGKYQDGFDSQVIKYVKCSNCGLQAKEVYDYCGVYDDDGREL